MLRIWRDSSNVQEQYKGAVLALGNFDGLHLGHQAVIAKTITIAESLNVPAGVLTFSPHPRRVLRPDLPTLKLYPFHTKARLLDTMGVKLLRVLNFNRALSEFSAEEFIERILHRQLNVAHVVTGEDFIFGHNRGGSIDTLCAAGKRLGFGVTACASMLSGMARCSSTRVRQLLTEGDVQGASVLLGRPYAITGRVQKGDARGRQLGFPTANLVPAGIFTPADGVYAITAQLQGKALKGVANLGIRPTVGGQRRQLEVHLFDWQGDIYGEQIEVALHQHLRAEKCFEGLDALKSQIAKDVAAAKEFLEK